MDTGINAVLVLAGVGAILAAIAGGGIVIGGLTIPKVEHSHLRVAICSVGVVFLIMGVGLQTGVLKALVTSKAEAKTRAELRADYVQDLLPFCYERHDQREILKDTRWKRSDDPDTFGRFLARLAGVEQDWNVAVATIEAPPDDGARLKDLYEPLYLRVQTLRAAARAATQRQSISEANRRLTEAWHLGKQFDKGAKEYGFGGYCPVSSAWVRPRKHV